jgi:transposase
MANQLKVHEQETIIHLAGMGWGIRRIARELGLSRNTVRNYYPEPSTVPPLAGSSSAQTDPLSTAGVDARVRQTDPPILTAGKSGRRSLCLDYDELIRSKAQAGLSAQRIYQDLQCEQGFGASYQSVKRYVQKLRITEPELIYRIEVQPGEEVQVDFGSGPLLLHPSGQRRRAWVFRLVLSYSRKAHSEAVLRQDTESFLRCMENAFRLFGGVPQSINLDNLKAAVIKADWADPDLNPKLVDFARHYGTAILPCLPRTPEHKGKVENSIKYLKGNALAGHQFDSLTQLNQHLTQWENTVADQRIHGTTKRQVAELFAAEKAALRPLPDSLFPCFREGPRIVHRDGYVEVEKAFYHVPVEYLRQEVWVRFDAREVRIFAKDRDGALAQIQVHRRLEPGQFTRVLGVGGGQGSLQANLNYWLNRASNLGSSCARWSSSLAQNRGIEGMRSLMGLVSLSQNHSFPALNQACEQALARGTFRLRDVRALLQTREIQTEIQFEQHHPLIRNLSEYGLFIHQQTQNT